MPKIVPSARVGVPVPANLPDDIMSLVCYYGPPGFTPAYDQALRFEVPIESLEQTSVNGQAYWVFDTSELAPIPGEVIAMYFTLEDDAGAGSGNEGDFSPVVSVPLDLTPPEALGQPLLLS